MLSEVKPKFAAEQDFLSGSFAFQSELKKLGDQIPAEKIKTLFISHTWPHSGKEEQWTRAFVVNFAKHLELLGFKVILDAQDVSVGVHLNSSTKAEVEKTDHAVLLITNNYLKKINQTVESGIAIELDFFQNKISSNEGFLVLFSLVDDLSSFPGLEKPREFPAIFVNQIGYLNALLELPKKLYGVNTEQVGRNFIKPRCLEEQEQLSENVALQAELKKIGAKVLLDKRKTIFISRAWPLSPEEDEFYEQWTAVFVENLAKHLQLLGFNVILDVKDLGNGVHLNTAMKDSVNKADHVLLVITNTYLHKIKESPGSGVAVEFSYIKEKVRLMGGGSVAGKSRFVLSFSLVNDLTGFPLIEGHGGFATNFVNHTGYVHSLLDLVTKVYGLDVSFSLKDYFASSQYFLPPPNQHSSVILDVEKKVLPKSKL